jgi:hypothetical protein
MSSAVHPRLACQLHGGISNAASLIHELRLSVSPLVCVLLQGIAQYGLFLKLVGSQNDKTQHLVGKLRVSPLPLVKRHAEYFSDTVWAKHREMSPSMQECSSLALTRQVIFS